MNDGVGREIGIGLGEILDVDVKATNSKRTCFLQVRIDIPLDKPLQSRALVVSPEGDRMWVAFKYEQIVELRFSCRRLGHELKGCPHRRLSQNPTDSKDTPYGDWMKAGG